MARSIEGEVAIVTGASSGIGAATALELGRHGAKVALAARRADELAGVAQAIKQDGGEALVIPTDVTDPGQVERLVRQVTDAYGRVDVLVNNAGIGASGKLAEMPTQEFVQVVYANLLGPMLLTRAVLPGMIARRHGAIISVASVAGHVAVNPLYSATKFGMRGFSLSLRRELQGTGVSASVVSPGFIRTPMTAYQRGPLPGPEIIARTIARLIVHPRRELIVPRYYHGAVWVERLFPWLVDRAT
ncbi:MAG TPA: SDR family oxidoreductase [Ktedonobacterales bacterium]|nr:SDR family oxidoreductase [Ktedonobacterales bacterium]